jgi:Mn-dependent DtxR family transcriptional regulator
VKNDITAALTPKQQAYLETIDELCREHGHAHSKGIAGRLNVTMASVTDALRTLKNLGLINYQPRRAVTLTSEGICIAAELHVRHRVLESFFTDILGCSRARATMIACQVEHVIDEQFRHRLKSFIQFTEARKNAQNLNIIEEFKQAYRDDIS